MSPERRPNFIFFNPDELRADAVHHLDGRPVQTPNLDRLAAEGVTFGQCHVQNTVCTPSRCSFMTGWYPHVRGHRTLWHMLQPHEPNLLKTPEASWLPDVIWHGKNDLLARDSFPDSVTYHCDQPGASGDVPAKSLAAGPPALPQLLLRLPRRVALRRLGRDARRARPASSSPARRRSRSSSSCR